jgi:hypothetical protein
MPYSSTRGAYPRIIVVHTGEGILGRFDMVRFLDNNPDASAHAASDADGVEGPLVPYERAAWTAGSSANSIGLHIEMCAFAQMTREQWLSEADVTIWIQWLNNGQGAYRTIRRPMSMLRWTARWVASVAAMYNIPLAKIGASQIRNGQKGVCGHADTSAAFGETDHTDPGGAFPWDVFIALAQGTTQEDDLSAAAEEMIRQMYVSMSKMSGQRGLDIGDAFVSMFDSLKPVAVETGPKGADGKAPTIMVRPNEAAANVYGQTFYGSNYGAGPAIVRQLAEATGITIDFDEGELAQNINGTVSAVVLQAVVEIALPAIREVIGEDNEDQAQAVVDLIHKKLGGAA